MKKHKWHPEICHFINGGKVQFNSFENRFEWFDLKPDTRLSVFDNPAYLFKIKIENKNNELEMVNGCHSTLHPNRCQHEYVEHSKGNVKWPYIFTRSCQYDNKVNDKGCNGCNQQSSTVNTED